MPTLQDAHQLLQLADITRNSINQIIAEWAKLPSSSPKEDNGADESEKTLPSHELFEAQRTLIAATGKLTELVSDPSSRLLEVSSQYNEARCLHIAAVLKIPDFLSESGNKGVSLEDVAKKVGIEKRKLGMFASEDWSQFPIRLLTMLCFYSRSHLALSMLDPHFPGVGGRRFCKQRNFSSPG